MKKYIINISRKFVIIVKKYVIYDLICVIVLIGDIMMKKIMIALLWMIVLQGCNTCQKEVTPPISVNMVDDSIRTFWEGTYVHDDFELFIKFPDEFPQSLEYQFFLNGFGFGDYLDVKEISNQTFIAKDEKIGYAVEIRKQGHSIFVKEIKGESPLGFDVSGEYKRK